MQTIYTIETKKKTEDCEDCPKMTYNVSSGMLKSTTIVICCFFQQ